MIAEREDTLIDIPDTGTCTEVHVSDMYIFSIGRCQIHRDWRLACARLQFLPLGKVRYILKSSGRREDGKALQGTGSPALAKGRFAVVGTLNL